MGRAMIDPNSKALLHAFGHELKDNTPLLPTPLSIKLRLEQLRVAELISAATEVVESHKPDPLAWLKPSFA